jgi:nucleolar protein 58
LELQHFSKFDDTTVALAAITGSIEGKIPKPLKKLLKKIAEDTEETLLVADAKLGSSIKVIYKINPRSYFIYIEL